MAGPELISTSAAVREALEFRTVHREGQPSFDANRLALPVPTHFDQVAAFICTELLRSGADTSLAGAFAATEPIIELAIERLLVLDRIVVGLLGELLLLEALCRRSTPTHVAQLVESWDGWRRSSRDFTLGSLGIEVKTTAGNTSSHIVEGVHQVERNTIAMDGDAEDRLLLVSIGVQANTGETNSVTIPGLVDRILGRMVDAGMDETAVGAFLSHLAEYGRDSGGGYDHKERTSNAAFSKSFLTTFFRAYDMADDAIQVLRRQDVTVRAHVDVGSVKFRIDLPAAVSAENPMVGANQVALAILDELA